MSTPVVISGVTYNIPAYNDTGWAQGSGNLSSFLISVGTIAGARVNDGTNYSSKVLKSSAVSSTGSGQYFDITSQSFPAGVWNLTGVIGISWNTIPASTVITLINGGLGTASGNSGTGLSAGDSYFSLAPFNSATDATITIPSLIVSIATTTIYYLKSNITYSGTTPTAYGRITGIQIG